jgi:DNA-binding CsgD family transcriptional regulator
MVEAAYAVDTSTPEWTRGLLDAADRSMGSGLGGFACLFQVKGDGTLAIDRTSHAVVRQAPEIVSAIFDGLAHAPPGWLSTYMSNPRSASFCLMTSEVDPGAKLSYRPRLAREGVHDGINIACMGLDRHGVLISLGVGAGVGLSPQIRRNLVRIATHVVAAQRLRRRLGDAHSAPVGPSGSLEGSVAILSPDGKVVHAGGEAALAGARRNLRNAVSDIEHARTSSRDDPEKALSLWKGLVSARWTLIDQFDAQGTKYIVAKENVPASAALAKLTPTENCVVKYAAQGYSTKEIAYALGIKDTTVRVLITRAVRRCGVRSRHELLKLEQKCGPDPLVRNRTQPA